MAQHRQPAELLGRPTTNSARSNGHNIGAQGRRTHTPLSHPRANPIIKAASRERSPGMTLQPNARDLIYRTSHLHEADLVANELQRLDIAFYRAQEGPLGVQWAMPVWAAWDWRRGMTPKQKRFWRAMAWAWLILTATGLVVAIVNALRE